LLSKFGDYTLTLLLFLANAGRPNITPTQIFYTLGLVLTPTIFGGVFSKQVGLFKKGPAGKLATVKILISWKTIGYLLEMGSKSSPDQDSNHNISTVKDIISSHPDIRWNSNLIDKVFLPFESNVIKQIPLLQEPMDEDQLMWPYTREGVYSVKTGYNVLNTSKTITPSAQLLTPTTQFGKGSGLYPPSLDIRSCFGGFINKHSQSEVLSVFQYTEFTIVQYFLISM
jgi:hypothetical protein